MVKWAYYTLVSCNKPDKSAFPIDKLQSLTIQYRMAKSKLDPFIHLLGTTPDADVARLAGCSRERVRQVRGIHNILLPPENRGKHNLLAPAVYEALARLAGTLTDAETARQAGCSERLVGNYRRQHGIKAHPASYQRFPFTPEHLALMGVLSDRLVAEQAGCGLMTVFHYRKKHGIAQAYDGRRERKRKRLEGQASEKV